MFPDYLKPHERMIIFVYLQSGRNKRVAMGITGHRHMSSIDRVLNEHDELISELVRINIR